MCTKTPVTEVLVPLVVWALLAVSTSAGSGVISQTDRFRLLTKSLCQRDFGNRRDIGEGFTIAFTTTAARPLATTARLTATTGRRTVITFGHIDGVMR